MDEDANMAPFEEIIGWPRSPAHDPSVPTKTQIVSPTVARAYARACQVSRGYLQRRYPQVRVLTVASEGQADLVKPFTPSQLPATVCRRSARR
jgi:hypothetical protein